MYTYYFLFVLKVLYLKLNKFDHRSLYVYNEQGDEYEKESRKK